MTSIVQQEVYIRGDLGTPTDCKVFDAQSHQQINDIAEMQITLDARRGSYADVRRVNSSAMERLKIVPMRSAFAGQRVRLFTISERHDPGRSHRLIESKALAFRVTSDGRLEGDHLADYQNRTTVDDLALAKTRNPQDMMQHMVEQHLRTLMQGAVIDPMVADMGKLANAGFAKGGVVSNPGALSGIPSATTPPQVLPTPTRKPRNVSGRKAGPTVVNVVDPNDAIKRGDAIIDAIRGKRDSDGGGIYKAVVCSECKGTGWYEGFNSKEPCSQGCPPKDD